MEMLTRLWEKSRHDVTQAAENSKGWEHNQEDEVGIQGDLRDPRHKTEQQAGNDQDNWIRRLKPSCKGPRKPRRTAATEAESVVRHECPYPP